MQQALILFVRHPEKGKVKTRLAATAGEAAALRVYQHLLDHTAALVAALSCDVHVFYADTMPDEDRWSKAGYSRQLQSGGDLGQRMHAAFTQLFAQGYAQVCIIGSDCAELQAAHVRQAFALLQEQEVVIGPAQDGGYYLLGLTRPLALLFEDIPWSTEHVFSRTLAQLRAAGLPYATLPLLRDVDTWEDVPVRWRV